MYWRLSRNKVTQGWMDDPATDGAEAIRYAQMAQERGRK